MRCLHEAKLYQANAFITLTYDDAHLPANGLDHSDFQKFMKRLRKASAPNRVRFYMCGEYGEQLARPHFHACLFNVAFNDQLHWATGESGEKIYRSATLEKLWPFGFASIGEVNFQTAAYIARYCMKKITGHNAKYYYGQKKPEYNAMSLKPGIGKEFLEKWETDIYPNDYVIVNGIKMKPPKYYDEIMNKKNKEIMKKIKYERELEGVKHQIDNTQRRLNDKEEVQKARIRNLKRNMVEYENS